ncbi:MAG: DegQ family serine endoprotease [Burkholderiales bacterium]|nr:MAG: DegQ family serine endoprotease [Burkholderiales bacterium]
MKRRLSACLLVLGTTFTAFVAPAAQAQQAAVERGLPDFADLVERAGPAVVNIRTTERARANAPAAGPGAPGAPQMPEGMDENDPFYEFFRRFFPPRQQPGPGGPRGGRGGDGNEVPRGVGSGFIISPDGFVLTNHHVVEGADEIYVTLTDKRELKGKLIGSDRRTDVALVKIESASLPAMKIGDPQRLRVGEWVIAIGSPFGLENTVTAGIVSAKGRDTGDYLPFIQTDVAVNPGNSGGPLLNMRGEVIGINSQIYSRTGGFMGISFAIPIDEAMRVAEQIRITGRVTRGRIGVGIAEVTKDVAEPLGLQRAAGALVRNVEAGGPAEKGGIEVGDIILKFDGKPIEKSTDLPRMVGNTKPGSKVPVGVWRKGANRELTITVAEMQPEQTARANGGNRPQQTPGGSAQASNSLGLVVADIPEDRRNALRIKGGVLVEAVDGAAARAGLRAGDVILSLNNQDVTGAKAFNDAVGKLDRTKTHILLVRRGESAQFIPIRPAAQNGQ